MLSSLPIYFISSFRLPRIVKLKLEKIQRDFLWGGVPRLAPWNVVCLAKDGGVLGVKRLDTLNKPLLGKCIWHSIEERGMV